MDVSIVFNLVYDERNLIPIIQSAMNLNPKYTYEILGYGTIPISNNLLSQITSYELVTPEQDAENGYSIYGYNHLCQQSSGKYVVVGVEGIYYHHLCSAIDDLVNLDRKIKVIVPKGFGENAPCYSHNYGPAAQFIKPGQDDVFYDREDCVTVRFPILERDTIDNYLDGVIFNDSFKHHCPDLWLGYYMGTMDQPCVECSNCYAQSLDPNSNTRFDEHDMQTLYQLKYNLINNYHTRYDQKV